MIVGILLFQAVTFAVLSAIVASNKNRDPAGWGVLGFLFGLFAFIAAIAVSEVEEGEGQSASRGRSTPSSSAQFNPDEHDKKCPMCAEYIKLEARRCRHCGHEMSEEEVERQIETTKAEQKESQSGQTGDSNKPPQSEASTTDDSSKVFAVLSVLLVLVVAAGAIIFWTSKETSSQNRDTSEPSETAEISPQPQSALGDTVLLTVVATDAVRELRIQQDDDLTRPYWLQQGEAEVFPFTQRITISNQLNRVRLLLEGHPYQSTPENRGEGIVIDREKASEVIGSSEPDTSFRFQKPDTIRLNKK